MRTKYQPGFTLVEMAVVVFLIGALATIGLSALNAQLASASINNTKKKQEIIKDALISYLGTNKRLPCPDTDNDGNENRNPAIPNACVGLYGLLPYQNLGLSRSAALDGWNDFFSYSVSTQWTLTYGTALNVNTSNIADAAFNVGDTGNITVSERIPATNPAPAANPNIVALVISHGKNGLGSFTPKGTQSALAAVGTDELANAPQQGLWTPPATFFQREYTEIDVPLYGAFDDVMLVINSTDFISPLVKDGALKSAEAEWAEQKENINNAVIGFIFSPANPNCSIPTAADLVVLLTNSNIPLIDPWGDPIAANYVQNFCRIRDDGSVRMGVGCGITSNGPIATYTINSPRGGVVNGKTNQQLFAVPSFSNIIMDKC